MAQRIEGYAIDSAGKIFPLPWDDNNRKRGTIQNEAIKDSAFKNVDFNDGAWYDRIKAQGGQYFRSLSEAEKFSKDIISKSEAAIKEKQDAENKKKELELIDLIKKSASSPASSGATQYAGGTPAFDEKTGKPVVQTPAQASAQTAAQTAAVKALSADNNVGTSILSSKLNSQVSDKQILDDYNTSKLSKLKSIADSGTAQITGISARLDSVKSLVSKLPAGDAQKAASDTYVKQLEADLASVRSAVADATKQVQTFKPITIDSTQAASQINSFREYLKLPEQNAAKQIQEIDPESYKTSVALGQKYGEMATGAIGPTQNAQTEAFRAQVEKGYKDYSASGIGATTTPETEAFRRRIESEAMSQLALGSQLGAEEQRQYQQAARAAQSARGNIFGIAPAVEEAVTTGAAGEQRKLARYGAASQFLSSGQTTGDALSRDVQLRNALQQSKLGAGGQFLSSGQSMSDAMRGDIAFRDALQQNRLGAAANFVGGGPSVYNLANQRTGQQQSAMQQYIQANQALPGQFGQQPSTASNFYQTTDPSIPVALTNAFNQLYSSQANYGSSVYGSQVGALSRMPNAFQNFATVAGGVKDLAGAAGGMASMGILCWVAREVYGIENPKWLQFREWMLTKASDNLRNFYIKYGERIAESIRNKPKIKAIIRKWMDGKIK